MMASDQAAVGAARRPEWNEKYCFECGSIIRAKAEVCPDCGVRQPMHREHAPDEGRSKLVAALLAIFLGFVGVHKFYLGRPGWGVLYLMFFWTGIPAIVGFVEGLIFLAMSRREFDERFNRA